MLLFFRFYRKMIFMRRRILPHKVTKKRDNPSSQVSVKTTNKKPLHKQRMQGFFMKFTVKRQSSILIKFPFLSNSIVISPDNSTSYP